MNIRLGESGCDFFRADRFYQISNQWYFSTRENLQIGPYNALDEAEVELMSFLRHIGEGGYAADAYLAAAHI